MPTCFNISNDFSAGRRPTLDMDRSGVATLEALAVREAVCGMVSLI